jgi:D-tagatose-1,6-bisphosphate aldolase subunit GatZ/KbaZ
VAFRRQGLDAALERVVALVVQPGVEFDNEHVVDYQPAKAERLIQCLSEHANLVFEAHSTDYQTPAALAALVRDHFAILKVGPGVTFALREALWALDRIRAEYRPDTPALRDAVLTVMQQEPAYWRKYYPGEGTALQLQLQYSLSDRIRYYWNHPAVGAAVTALFATIDAQVPPAAVLSQYLPAGYAAVRACRLQPRAADLVRHHIQQLLGDYSKACGQSAT